MIGLAWLRKISQFFFWLALLFAVQPATAVSAFADEAERIASLHLRFEGETVQLIGVKIAPGHLKPRLERKSETLLVEVISPSGRLMWSSRIGDPRTRIIEGPDSSGTLRTRISARSAAEENVRVPLIEDGQSVRISRVSMGANGMPQFTALGTVKVHGN